MPFVLQPATPDRQLEQKLAIEAPAILRWMIDGCLHWQAHGLLRPASVKAATDAYFSDQDLMGQWIEDRCEVRTGLWDKSADLFDNWTDYVHKAGENPGSKKAFGQAMQRRGFEPDRITDGIRVFRSVRLRSAASSHGGNDA